MQHWKLDIKVKISCKVHRYIDHGLFLLSWYRCIPSSHRDHIKPPQLHPDITPIQGVCTALSFTAWTSNTPRFYARLQILKTGKRFTFMIVSSMVITPYNIRKTLKTRNTCPEYPENPESPENPEYLQYISGKPGIPVRKLRMSYSRGLPIKYSSY